MFAPLFGNCGFALFHDNVRAVHGAFRRGRLVSVQGALWAITSYFNPAGYRRRLLNYRRFRADKPAMHTLLRDYFSRGDDGRTAG